MLFPPKKAHWLEEGYFKKLHAAGKEEKEVCQLLITIGFLLDGKLSMREKMQINELRREGLLEMDITLIKKYQQDFLNGRGIDGLIKTYIA